MGVDSGTGCGTEPIEAIETLIEIVEAGIDLIQPGID
jgi:hypothetical protein